jgi:hypothetical protein
MVKKPYSPPTLTDHGDAVEKTKGLGGAWWEYIGAQYGPPLPPLPPPDSKT